MGQFKPYDARSSGMGSGTSKINERGIRKNKKRTKNKARLKKKKKRRVMK